MAILQKRLVRVEAVALFLVVSLSCGTVNQTVNQRIQDICNCLSVEPDALDYRHNAKHIALPSGTPQETDVATILTWPEDVVPLPVDAPRSGRELQLTHIATAYLENASVNPADCDIHLEISQTADKTAPRMIIETPIDSEYCSARQTIQQQLKQHGFSLDLQHGGDLSQPLAVSVLGLPLEDFEHPGGRGSAQVATLWELHPAVVTFH